MLVKELVGGPWLARGPIQQYWNGNNPQIVAWIMCGYCVSIAWLNTTVPRKGYTQSQRRVPGRAYDKADKEY